MKKLNTLLCFMVMLGLGTVAFSQNIAFHTSDEGNTEPYITALRNAGYTVTVGNTWAKLDEAGKNDLNSNYDLVIIARYSSSNNFGAGPEDPIHIAWNQVTTPILMSSAYDTRASKAAWFSTSGIGNNGSSIMKVEVPEHPIFRNTIVDAEGLTPAVFNEGADYADVTEAGESGVALTTDSETPGRFGIVEWPAGVEAYPGSGVASGHRMFFPSNDKNPDLTDDGLMLWLDIVEYMLTDTVTDKRTPTNIQISSDSFAVNTPFGAPVGELSASDPQDDIASYALVAGEGDDNNDLFLIDGIALLLNEDLDKNNDKLLDLASPNLSIRVQVTDSTGNTFEKALALLVTAFDDAPGDIYLDNDSILENQDTASLVGILSAYDANGDIKMYELVAGDGDEGNMYFSIVGDTLKSDSVFNYENQTTFSIRVMVTDSADQSFSKVFAINIVDIDESPTDIFIDNDTIAENLPAGTKIATIGGDDPQNDIVSFELTEGEGSDHNSWFYIDGDSLYSNASFDYEFIDTLSIRIKATDSEGSSSDKVFPIAVIDKEDVFAPTANQQYRINVIGSTTKDAGYAELLRQNGYDVDLVGSYVLTAEMVDSVTENYDLIILTRSANSGNYVNPDVWQTVTTPVINMSAYISRTSRLGYIETNSASGTVDTVFIVKQPGHPVFNYASINAADSSIAGITTEQCNANPWVQGNGLLLATFPEGEVAMAEWKVGLPYFNGGGVLAGRRMIFQGSSSYNLTERGDSLFLDAVEYMITGSIGAPNEVAVDVNTIVENTAIGTVVDTLVALDRHGDVASYALVEGDGDVDNELFALDGDILKIAGDINYEVKEMLSIRVQVVDVDGNTFDEIIEFTVQDVPEAPYGVELSDPEVTELDEAGVLVGTLMGLDEDEDADMFALVAGEGSDDNASFEIDTIFSYTYTYYLDSSYLDIDTVFADDNSIVSIDTIYTTIDSTMTDTTAHYEGIGLYTTAIFDYETDTSLSVRVQVTDTTNFTFAEALSIAVVDVNEDPTDISFTGNMITENNAVGDVIGVLSGTDPQDDIATYELTSGDGDTNNDMVTIDGTDVKAAVVFDYETMTLLIFRVKVVDVLGNSYEEILYTVILDDPSDNSTAIQSLTADDIDVYPNPSATGVFKMELEGVSNATVTISDMLGRIIVKEQTFSDKTVINLQGMPAGNYIATIVANNKVIVKKLINE